MNNGINYQNIADGLKNGKSDEYKFREGKTKDKEEEALKQKYAEEILDRKAKAGISANNYNCSVKMAKFQ